MKYVIVGTGNISNTYVKAISELEHSELVGCISRSGKHLPANAEAPCWPSLAAVKADFDAVIVTTPNGLHCQGAIEAAKLGKHVLTEKPLGITIEQVDQAIAACEQAGLTLAVCFQRRTSPDNQAIKELLSKNALGRIFSADLSAKFYRGQDYYDSAAYRGGYDIDGGGPFMQQACHNLDLYTWFFGLPTKVVSTMGTFAHNIQAEDHGAALLKYDNGMIGSVVASTATWPGFAARLEVHSDKGSFTMTDDVISQWHFEDIPNPSDSNFNYNHDGATSAAVDDCSAHKSILLDFEDAIAQGRAPLANAQSARQTTALISQIYQSTNW
ncbi:Predicted dehydrogenase [Alteromonadaceae bacterium Bs31]|nr:Predicted dehydrogenase [Alteromonadaceae bacterium Bs31]